jgi:hypothetical protein
MRQQQRNECVSESNNILRTLKQHRLQFKMVFTWVDGASAEAAMPGAKVGRQCVSQFCPRHSSPYGRLQRLSTVTTSMPDTMFVFTAAQLESCARAVSV